MRRKYSRPKREEFVKFAKRISENPHFIDGYIIGAELARTKFPKRLLDWAKTRERPIIFAVGRDAIPLLKTLFIERRIPRSNVPVKFIGVSGDHPKLKELKNAVEELRGTRLENMVYEYGGLVPEIAGKKRYENIKKAKEDLLWEIHEIERAKGIEASRDLAEEIDRISKEAGARNIILVDWGHIGTHPIVLATGLWKRGWGIENIHTGMAFAKEPANRIHEAVGGVIHPKDKEAMHAVNLGEFAPKIMGPYAEVNRPAGLHPERRDAWAAFIHGVERGYLEHRTSKQVTRKTGNC